MDAIIGGHYAIDATDDGDLFVHADHGILPPWSTRLLQYLHDVSRCG
ncbi:MAG: hypothetical protein H0W78_07895 [Planctomycetes bacterium]|nr:hypothetical protein [Planctomycetota bacterium]